MSDRYQVVFHAKGHAETRGLPAAAFESLIQALGVVSRDPWANSTQEDLKGDPERRWAAFGDYGMVHLYINEVNLTVIVHGVVWTN